MRVSLPFRLRQVHQNCKFGEIPAGGLQRIVFTKCLDAGVDGQLENVMSPQHWWRRVSNFHFRGCSPGNLEDGSPPETEAVCRHCSQILTAETFEIPNYGIDTLIILDNYVSRWGR